MIMPSMKATSAAERGGSAARVDGGRTLLGCPGAPGCTMAGDGERADDCACACACAHSNAIAMAGTAHEYRAGNTRKHRSSRAGSMDEPDKLARRGAPQASSPHLLAVPHTITFVPRLTFFVGKGGA